MRSPFGNVLENTYIHPSGKTLIPSGFASTITSRRVPGMGVFTVEMRVRNWQNRYLPPERQGEEVVCEALVDSGAAELALPAELIERLKLEQLGSVRVYTADGGQHEYRVFGIAEVEVQGRTCQVRAIELPHSAVPLLGAVPLEEMDWHVSPLEKALRPNPKSPERPLLPLC
jgi:clan AA aspartic protease